MSEFISFIVGTFFGTTALVCFALCVVNKDGDNYE